MPPPKEAPAASRAYLALERLIVTLELPPGGLTTEQALVERTGLGRTPVREAIQRLAWEGLVEIRPRAGIAVAALHPADWVRVLDARRGVEVVLARSAARYIGRDDGALFHEAALAMQRSVVGGDVFAFLEADKALDEAIASAADNPFAARLAAPLQTHSRRFWFRYQGTGALAASAEAHVAIILAITSGDAAAAANAAGTLMDLLRADAEEVARG